MSGEFPPQGASDPGGPQGQPGEFNPYGHPGMPPMNALPAGDPLRANTDPDALHFVRDSGADGEAYDPDPITEEFAAVKNGQAASASPEQADDDWDDGEWGFQDPITGEWHEAEVVDEDAGGQTAASGPSAGHGVGDENTYMKYDSASGDGRSWYTPPPGSSGAGSHRPGSAGGWTGPSEEAWNAHTDATERVADAVNLNTAAGALGDKHVGDRVDAMGNAVRQNTRYTVEGAKRVEGAVKDVSHRLYDVNSKLDAAETAAQGRYDAGQTAEDARDATRKIQAEQRVDDLKAEIERLHKLAEAAAGTRHDEVKPLAERTADASEAAADLLQKQEDRELARRQQLQDMVTNRVNHNASGYGTLADSRAGNIDGSAGIATGLSPSAYSKAPAMPKDVTRQGFMTVFSELLGGRGKGDNYYSGRGPANGGKDPKRRPWWKI